MFRTKNTPVQITVPNYREPLSGIVNTPMAKHSLVQLDTAAGDANIFIAADGGRCVLLEREVVSLEDWNTYQKGNPEWRNDLTAPVPVGSCVSGRFFHEAEFEGAAFFTGVDGDTAANTLLKVADGKFAIADVTVPDAGQVVDIPQFRLQKKVDPVDSATFRWVIENLE